MVVVLQVACSRKNDYRTDLRWRLEYNEKHTHSTQAHNVKVFLSTI